MADEPIAHVVTRVLAFIDRANLGQWEHWDARTDAVTLAREVARLCDALTTIATASEWADHGSPELEAVAREALAMEVSQ